MPAYDRYPVLDHRDMADMRLLSHFVRTLPFDAAVPFAAAVSGMGLSRHGLSGLRRVTGVVFSGLSRLSLGRDQMGVRGRALLLWHVMYGLAPDEAARFVTTFARTVTDTRCKCSPVAAGPLDQDAVRTTLAVLEVNAADPKMSDRLDDAIREWRERP